MKKNIMEIFSEGITDPRSGGTSHKLIDVIIIGILAVLTGAKGFTDMATFGKESHEWLKTFLELPKGIPSHDVFNDIFAAINPKEFHKCFKEWVELLIETFDAQVVGIDGKTARRTKDLTKGKQALHVVSAFASSNSLILGQIATEEKSNEITAIPELLKTLVIKGCIITIDAMGTQKKISQTIINSEADYILNLKENQKTLHDDVALYLQEEILTQDKAALKTKGQFYKTIEKGHGRIETRECYICEDINWLTQKEEWSGLKGIAAILSTRDIKGVKSSEMSYYIYSVKAIC